MKNNLILIFFAMQSFSLFAQINIKRNEYIEGIVQTVKEDAPDLFFTLKLRTTNRKEYTVLITNGSIFK